MTVSTEKKGEEAIVAPVGSINTQTAAQFQDAISSVLTGTKKMTIDLKDVDYISSAGLRVFLWAENTMEAQGEMTVINIRSEVKEVFDMTGFSGILNLG
jgi:anti-sigma B factor antagonist